MRHYFGATLCQYNDLHVVIKMTGSNWFGGVLEDVIVYTGTTGNTSLDWGRDSGEGRLRGEDPSLVESG